MPSHSGYNITLLHWRE